MKDETQFFDEPRAKNIKVMLDDKAEVQFLHKKDGMAMSVKLDEKQARYLGKHLLEWARDESAPDLEVVEDKEQESENGREEDTRGVV